MSNVLLTFILSISTSTSTSSLVLPKLQLDKLAMSILHCVLDACSWSTWPSAMMVRPVAVKLRSLGTSFFENGAFQHYAFGAAATAGVPDRLKKQEQEELLADHPASQKVDEVEGNFMDPFAPDSPMNPMKGAAVKAIDAANAMLDKGPEQVLMELKAKVDDLESASPLMDKLSKRVKEKEGVQDLKTKLETEYALIMQKVRSSYDGFRASLDEFSKAADSGNSDAVAAIVEREAAIKLWRSKMLLENTVLQAQHKIVQARKMLFQGVQDAVGHMKKVGGLATGAMVGQKNNAGSLLTNTFATPDSRFVGKDPNEMTEDELAAFRAAQKNCKLDLTKKYDLDAMTDEELDNHIKLLSKCKSHKLFGEDLNMQKLRDRYMHFPKNFSFNDLMA
ncbi:unnamed protein product, partial [Amoebophrya sp. A25]|eukprot:GSA25T00003808001.1